ncbi:MAG: UDP-N-acetylmuramoyl-L-alanyl-D-glutamate--2,6-diaminopimelate ligase [Deltaproteobacteria bacterium]|jgi:UDP-N-acetylmuramoyl-L-alanyl-D-glutamate--2,6-diaminopimelate ligase|nr:UDP-N-acetylmuramoyl-L-alanyl-D-glutamate--2,6-diaminopimelate ligase [Deltaproteobacteria bacterium]
MIAKAKQFKILSLTEAASLVRGGFAAGRGPAPQTHSGKVRSGDLFVVLPANRTAQPNHAVKSGLDYLPQILSDGIAGVLVYEEKQEAEVRSLLEAAAPDCYPALCPVPDARQALGVLAAAYYGTEDYRPTLIGITGTNGKTTSAFLLEGLFTAAGRRVGMLGTICYRWPGFSQVAPLTTPGCLELHGLFARMRQAAVDTVIMEVSSHALDQNRVAGLAFSAALFTNLTQDHLDYHKDMEEYFQAKARLFGDDIPSLGQSGVPLLNKSRAINLNDSFGKRLYKKCRDLPGLTVPYALRGAEELEEINSPSGVSLLSDPSDVSLLSKLSGELLRTSPDGLHLRMRYAGAQWDLDSPLVGEFNAMNLLGVQTLALSLGLKTEDLRVLEKFSGVPGRLERVLREDGSRPALDCFVDYAHTPDALIKAIKALRAAGFGRVVTVFGCGGDRDRGKRPLMGEAVSRYADVAVLTSDNPRTEDPEAIMDDVMPGLQAGMGSEVYREADRRKATALALGLMRPGDALLLAGKGHEDYQIIGTEKIHYSDQEVLRELLK